MVHTAAFLILYKALHLTKCENLKILTFFVGPCSVIWWNWTFHFLTRPIFCRWGYRHYSVMADTPTPEHPFSGISSRAWVFQNLNIHHQLTFQKFSKYFNIRKLSVFDKLAALKLSFQGKQYWDTILFHPELFHTRHHKVGWWSK